MPPETGRYADEKILTAEEEKKEIECRIKEKKEAIKLINTEINGLHTRLSVLNKRIEEERKMRPGIVVRLKAFPGKQYIILADFPASVRQYEIVEVVRKDPDNLVLLSDVSGEGTFVYSWSPKRDLEVVP